MEKRIGLLFDCLRAPYDAAHIFQLASALGNCDLYISGNSIDMNHPKIVAKVKSWGIEKMPMVKKFGALDEAADYLHNNGKYLIGTSPYSNKTLYELDLSEGNKVFVFGTETSGLSEKKIMKLDEMISIPITKETPFLTLPTAVPIVAYEYYRQLGAKK